MRLRTQVVDLIWLNALDQRHQSGAIGEIAVMKEESGLRIVRIAVEVINSRGVERRRSPDQAVYLVTPLDEKLGEIGAILAGDSGDECALSVCRGHASKGSAK